MGESLNSSESVALTYIGRRAREDLKILGWQAEI
jgi:hypothetical protein